ncbi:hypothetical protein [Sphingobium sp. B12D2B]|uniref:hypothetical protein n=1 Tax=Sphingobium sp. B12D2B TaxID=2940577 RepID=UPI002224C46D|nr:hypothetical protein [Sphingobium sp. B12D2B]MCW2350322.1 hypothetical protein [Sphingobium sp. B12D2B]
MRGRQIGLLAGLSALALSIPVLAQSGPESLLPPGFGDAAPTPSPSGPQPATPQPARPAAPAPTPLLPPGAVVDRAANAMAADEAVNETAADEIAEKYDLPPSARRSLDRIGPLKVAQGGLGESAFGQRNGQALAGVMRTMRAPVMSRWASILMRRALLSQLATPSDINGADWAAERAWLLLRMGEADNARLLIQQVDADQYSRRLYSVAMQVQLATADPAGFCPQLPRARDMSDEPGWFMAQAICASFSADQGTASALLSQAQRRGIARGIDYRLAEKVVGAGPNSRRSVKIEWDGVSQLTTWRYGLATATNVAIPPALFQTAGPQVLAWQARAANLSPMDRLAGVGVASQLGVFSGAATLGFFAALAEDESAEATANDRVDWLRTAYGLGDTGTRISAMRDFWQAQPSGGWSAGPGGVYYGALPAVARAAAALPVYAEAGEDTPWLIAAMLAGGYDRSAARWRSVLEELDGDAQQRSWALLATGLPDAAVDLSANRIAAFVDADEAEDKLRGHSLVAVLGGLNRLPAGERAQLLQDAGINMSSRRPWVRAIVAAAARREQGTVALLAGVGMQSLNWRNMTPEQLYYIISSLNAVGLEAYARMIGAEAMARL